MVVRESVWTVAPLCWGCRSCGVGHHTARLAVCACHPAMCSVLKVLGESSSLIQLLASTSAAMALHVLHPWPPAQLVCMLHRRCSFTVKTQAHCMSAAHKLTWLPSNTTAHQCSQPRERATASQKLPAQQVNDQPSCAVQLPGLDSTHCPASWLHNPLPAVSCDCEVNAGCVPGIHCIRVGRPHRQPGLAAARRPERLQSRMLLCMVLQTHSHSRGGDSGVSNELRKHAYLPAHTGHVLTLGADTQIHIRAPCNCLQDSCQCDTAPHLGLTHGVRHILGNAKGGRRCSSALATGWPPHCCVRPLPRGTAAALLTAAGAAAWPTCTPKKPATFNLPSSSTEQH